MLLPAMLASWTIFHTRYGASFATGYLQAAKNAQSPDPVSLHQSCRRDDRAATGSEIFMCRWRDENLYRSVSQITRDKFEQTMPQAYCCRAYNLSGRNTMYTRNFMAGQLVSAAPLYAADVPPTHSSPRNKSFVTTIIATGRSTRKGRGEYCRAGCAGSV